MTNMTRKEKFIYIFLIIITFGLIFLYWKTKKTEAKNELSKKSKISIDMNKLINYLGGEKNIQNSKFTNTKVQIYFVDYKLVNIEEIKKINGISGIFITSTYIQIIVGKEAEMVCEKLNNK